MFSALLDFYSLQHIFLSLTFIFGTFYLFSASGVVVEPAKQIEPTGRFKYWPGFFLFVVVIISLVWSLKQFVIECACSLILPSWLDFG